MRKIVMTQYIDKSALVAEIKGYISNYKEIVAKTNRNDSTWVDSVSMIDAKIDVLQHLLSFLNTLEVKEVDITSMADDYYDALIKEAEMDVDMAGHCRLAYYNGCKDVLNKIQKGE